MQYFTYLSIDSWKIEFNHFTNSKITEYPELKDLARQDLSRSNLIATEILMRNYISITLNQNLNLWINVGTRTEMLVKHQTLQVWFICLNGQLELYLKVLFFVMTLIGENISFHNIINRKIESRQSLCSIFYKFGFHSFGL